MKQIDFHFGVVNRSLYACHFVQKVTAMGLTVAVWGDQLLLERFFGDLWRFQDEAFIAHAWANSPWASDCHVIFSTDADALSGADVLILMSEQVPEDWKHFFERFDRVIEIVSRRESELVNARNRYKLYRAAGAVLKAYDRSQT